LTERGSRSGRGGEWAIVVHGGAGPIGEGRDETLRSGCAEAAARGAAVLESGGSAIDAVCAAVEHLEDVPDFNAGRGSVLNRAGEIEVDAGLMTSDLAIGAVAAVPWLLHPIRLARLVLEDGRHVLLAGEGALAFARRYGIEPEPRERMVTPRAEARHAARLARVPTGSESSEPGDTVGACALDLRGGLAAATSTGGTPGKRPGRVGDSPLAGAGFWVDARHGAASATGTGEAIIRVLASRQAIALLEVGHPVGTAAQGAVDAIGRPGRGEGGIIVLDRSGGIGLASSSQAMPWASIVGGRGASGVLRRDSL